MTGEGKFLPTRLEDTEPAGNSEREGDQQRTELVQVLAESGGVIGEKPTRDRTYSDRRFHRH